MSLDSEQDQDPDSNNMEESSINESLGPVNSECSVNIKKDLKKISQESNNKLLCEYYSGDNFCKRNHLINSHYCKYHDSIILLFKDVRNLNESCSTSKIIKFVPRSKQHLLTVMEKLNILEKFIDVLPRGINDILLMEEASYNDDDFIEIMSDSTRYYYESMRGKEKTKNLRVIFTKHCLDPGIIKINNTIYCESCYNKNNKFPGIHLVLRDL